MKDFDLEAAKRGAAVCTVGGIPVRIICFDSRISSRPIIGLLTYGSVEKINEYSEDGADLHDIGNNNLMMRDDDYLEKLERGEYGNHVEGSLDMVVPTCNEPLPPDREYWRRVYAGQIAGGLASHNGLNIIGSEIIVAKASCRIADALIKELEKTEK